MPREPQARQQQLELGRAFVDDADQVAALEVVECIFYEASVPFDLAPSA
jgi:hypothetical protein